MKDLKLRNLPYIRCNVVFRKSRSRGSSLSNNSKSCKMISMRSPVKSTTYIEDEVMIDVRLGNICIEVR